MPDPALIPSISKPLLRLFQRIVRGYFRRGFHAVRVRGVEQLAEISGPLIIYANHGSWWDPMVCFLLGGGLFAGRSHYAPMDERALKRYGLLRKMGIFGVEMESAQGAVQFLRTGAAVLGGGGVLWVTPQGKFVDLRERPLVFKPGLAALAARVAKTAGACTVLPLAIEYCFWDERTPECLLEFGQAIRVERGMRAGGLDGTFENALEAAMNSLKSVAMSRDAGAFKTLATGRVGTGGFYALGQRVRAFLARKPYRAEHTVVTEEGSGA